MNRLALVFVLICGGALAATEFEGKPNNPYGVMLDLAGGDHSDFAALHFRQAAQLVGEWGHVRVGSGVWGPDVEQAVRTLVLCRANRLRPVMTGLFVHPDYRRPEPGLDDAPFIREDGYPQSAERYRQWAAGLARLGAYPPYYEVGNEINGKWEPEAYGRFIVPISRALKSELPQMHVTSAGLAGNGGEFLEEVLRAVPEAAQHIDCYGLHPYGANHPPAYEKDGYGLRGHEWTAEHLSRVGVSDPRFVMTESGYELGNKKDPRYPRITDELRAKYLVEAYETVWAPDPRVVTLTLFMLQAVNYPGWHGWVLLHDDGTPNKTYNALAAVPKPAGSDWMPQGDGVLRGRITDRDTGLSVPHVFVYTVPGLYAAETDEAGRYTIMDVPQGEYEVRMFRDGFVAPAPERAAISPAGARHDARMTRVGLVPGGMDDGDKVARGWLPAEGWESTGEHYAVDRAVQRSGGASQRLSARPGNPPAVWICSAYATAVPGRTYAAEVWVKGQGLVRGTGDGPRLTVTISDSGAQPYSGAEAALPPEIEGDFDWTSLTVTIPTLPIGRRIVLNCALDAEAGTVWFDDAYLHYAEYPVPSRAMYTETGTAVIRGEVMAESQERLPEATLWLRQGNVWTKAKSDGRYELEELAAGTYDLCAFAHGWQCVTIPGIVLTYGDTLERDIVLPKPEVPAVLRNGDFERRGPEMPYTPEWTRYGEFDGFPGSGWHPELPEHPEGVQARTGTGFAGTITGSNIKNGGIYQVIAVEAEKTYEAGVWFYTYQTDDGQRGDAVSRLGLDPTGGTDPDGPYVIWTPYRPSHKAWSPLRLSAVANGDRMTLFLDQRQVVGLTYLLNIWDDATFGPAQEPLPEAYSKPAGIGYPMPQE